MEVKWLEDFLALAATSSFSRAAKMRNVTQPAFGRRIRALEHWVGVSLVDRSGYPMRLTDAGVRFRTTAAATLADLSDVRDALRNMSQSNAQILRFAALHSLALAFYPKWLASFASPPEILRSSLIADNMHDCMELLATGAVDFVLSYAHPWLRPLDGDIFTRMKVGQDEFMAVADRNFIEEIASSIDEAEGIPLMAYAPETILGQLVAGIRTRLEPLSFDLRYENSMAEALCAMIQSCPGVAWLPHSLVQDHLAQGKLSPVGGAKWQEPMDIILYRRNEKLRALSHAFWNDARAQAEASPLSLG